jgi:hypothetical protein
MSRAKHYRKVRIFIASPGDMATERARMHTIVEELNRTGQLANHLSLMLEALDWRTHVAPLMGRPQGVVLDQLPVESWDIFVGILWLRFGTPPGAATPGSESHSSLARRRSSRWPTTPGSDMDAPRC